MRRMQLKGEMATTTMDIVLGLNLPMVVEEPLHQLIATAATIAVVGVDVLVAFQGVQTTG